MVYKITYGQMLPTCILPQSTPEATACVIRYHTVLLWDTSQSFFSILYSLVNSTVRRPRHSPLLRSTEADFQLNAHAALLFYPLLSLYILCLTRTFKVFTVWQCSRVCGPWTYGNWKKTLNISAWLKTLSVTTCWIHWANLLYIMLENHCTQTAQSSWVGGSRLRAQNCVPGF